MLTLEDVHDMSMAMYVPDRTDDEAELRLKIFRREASLSLSRIMPHLSLLGVDVIDERPYELTMGKDQRAFVYDFGVRVPGGADAVRSPLDTGGAAAVHGRLLGFLRRRQ